MDALTKPILIMVASPSARAGERSPFLRFVRDHVHTLKHYSLHCTHGTALSVTGTGLYTDADIIPYKSGPLGGMVEIAAIVARGECDSVILLTDALDQAHDEVMTRVVKRIANRRGVRLVTSYGGAVLWARWEAGTTHSNHGNGNHGNGMPEGWIAGIGHDKEGWPLPLESRTVALTAHDASKNELVAFVVEACDVILRHHRVLATGASGWILKLLFGNPAQEKMYLSQLEADGISPLVTKALRTMLADSSFESPDLLTIAAAYRLKYGLVALPSFADKVIPLLAGVDGGDVLVSKEVLDHRCDTVVCLHDPREAVPLTDDSRMLEQTCQLREVHAACLTSKQSAIHWADGVRREMVGDDAVLAISDELRQRFDLSEVVVVDFEDDRDSDELGQALCRAAAGYLHSAIDRLLVAGGGRIAVSWGWAMNEVLTQLKTLKQEGFLPAPPVGGSALTWCSSIGNVPSPPALNAGRIAQGFRDHYGGRVEHFTDSGGFIEDPANLWPEDRALMAKLLSSDIVLESAAAWDEDSGLVVRTGWTPGHIFPAYGKAVGTMGGVFLADDGSSVGTAWSVVGLDHAALRDAAERKTVILVCGGERRRHVALAALRGSLASVLITSSATATWLIQTDTPGEVEPESLGRRADVRVPVEVRFGEAGELAVRVPSWHRDERAKVEMASFPESVKDRIASGPYPVHLFAIANLAANTPAGLELHDFEVPPTLGRRDYLSSSSSDI